jgi:hypothetical protein
LKLFAPISERVDLSDVIWLGRLDPKMARAVMDTCDPKVFGVVPPVRQYAQLYAFVHELSGAAEIHRWDDGNVLSGIVALSRLVKPTSVGFAYAARIGYESDGALEIVPAEIAGIGREAFLSLGCKRDWLTAADAARLRGLAPRLTRRLPRRVHNALWHHEYAVRTYYLDLRWTLVCTGLESVVHTDRFNSTRQFMRVCALAAEVGVGISSKEAGEAYDLRSQLAHGASFISAGSDSGPTPTQLSLYDRLEETLRRVVLKGMEDDTFADLLRCDDQIRKMWPLT